MSPAAEAALIDHAAGSEPALRAALSATLFLVSTEDAPRIERSHVALAVQGAGVATAKARPPVRWGRYRVGVAGAAALLAVMFSVEFQGQAGRVVVLVPAPSAPPVPQHLAAVKAAPSVVHATPTSDTTAARLPDGPDPVLRLFTGRLSGDEDTVTRRLAAAGMLPSLLRMSGGTGAVSAQIRYFFVEDKNLADRVAQIVGGAGLKTMLASQSSQMAPGSIDIILP